MLRRGSFRVILTDLLLRLACLLMLSCALLGAEGGGERNFDLPAGAAEKSLRLFSAQSGRPVIFPTDIARDVRTPAVRGRLTARAALAQLLAGTGLSAVSDEKSGALTIVRGPVEGERNTAPPPAPDLPPPAKKKLTP